MIVELIKMEDAILGLILLKGDGEEGIYAISFLPC